MLAAYDNEKDPKKQAAMYKAFTDPNNKDKHMRRYGSAAPPSAPPSSDDLRKKLASKGFSEPVIENMVKEYEKTDPTRKQALYDDMTNDARKPRMLEKYKAKKGDDPDNGGGGGGGKGHEDTPPSGNGGKGPEGSKTLTNDELQTKLAKKYPKKVVDEMLKKYAAAKDDTERDDLAKKWLGASGDAKKQIIKDIMPSTGTPETTNDTPDTNGTPSGNADPNKAKKKPKYASRTPLRKALKELGYTDPAIEKMVEAWNKADNDGKVALEEKFEDTNKKADNEKEYGSQTTCESSCDCTMRSWVSVNLCDSCPGR